MSWRAPELRIRTRSEVKFASTIYIRNDRFKKQRVMLIGWQINEPTAGKLWTASCTKSEKSWMIHTNFTKIRRITTVSQAEQFIRSKFRFQNSQRVRIGCWLERAHYSNTVEKSLIYRKPTTTCCRCFKIRMCIFGAHEKDENAIWRYNSSKSVTFHGSDLISLYVKLYEFLLSIKDAYVQPPPPHDSDFFQSKFNRTRRHDSSKSAVFHIEDLISLLIKLCRIRLSATHIRAYLYKDVAKDTLHSQFKQCNVKK